jgi:integrase
MGRIYKRGKVYWHQFRGRRRSLQTGDRKAAELAAALRERRAADPTYRPEDHTTLDGALREFKRKQAERGRAPETLDMYETHFGHLTRVLGNDTPIAELDAAEVDRYLTARHGEGASSQTRWKELCTLRGTLKLMRRHRKYPHPLDEVMPEDFAGRSSAAGTAFLTEAQLQKLMGKLQPKRAAVCAFIVATGADLGSIEVAQKKDIDLKKGLALVRGTKNKNRWRTVPILEPFRELLETSMQFMPFATWGNVRRDLAAACRRAKVPKVTPRDLRRSHGKILRLRGIEPQLIAPMLGHADARMVERVYGKLEPAELAKLIGQRLSGTKKVRRRPTPKRAPRKKTGGDK